MSARTDLDLRLFGTSVPEPGAESIEVGPWQLELRDGALTSVRLDGSEVARGIAFVARDENWGSPIPRVSAHRAARTGDEVTVDFDAEVEVGGSRVVYSGRLRAGADGELSFSVSGRAVGPVRTNRIGFVVLHPITGIAGEPLAVTHSDGQVEQSSFPLSISPGQPVFDIVALEHALPGGTRVRIAFEGGTFEMEDQRNWSDASYKTYYRSLLEPFPYDVADGEALEQTVRVTRVAAGTVRGGERGACRVALGAPLGPAAPVVALGLHAKRPVSPELVRDTLTAVPGARALVWLDLAGDEAGRSVAIEHARAAAAAGTEVALEVLFPDDDSGAEALEQAVRALAESHVRVSSAVGAPRAFLASFQPTDRWPEGLQPEQVRERLRAALPDARIGFGMLTYFTELNRRRPPASGHDFVNHGTCAIVHVADDRSVMQTTEALAQIAGTVRGMTGVAYHLGPCLIGMRSNPYGDRTLDNPERERLPMALEDPRQTGLFAAAFATGVAAAVCRERVDQLTLAELAGPLGVRAPDGPLFPVFHVVRGLARGAGQPLVEATVSDPTRLASIAWQRADGVELWLANLGPEPLDLAFDHCAGATSAVLDHDRLDEVDDPALLDRLEDGVPERLGPYAVARVVVP